MRTPWWIWAPSISSRLGPERWRPLTERSAPSAAAGLREDPTDLDSLDYLVDILRGTRTKDKLAQYKGILDRWGGVDSSPIYVDDAPLGPRR